MDRLAVLLVIVFLTNIRSGFGQDFNYSDLEDLLQVGGPVKITEIAKGPSARNINESFEDGVENFIKLNELSIETPFKSTVTLSGRNLDDGEIDLKLRLDSGSKLQARKKSKIRKVLAPILVVLLLKAITLIPLGLALVGLKTWNALQLSFVSFVTSVVLAVWKFCSKFSDHHHPPPIFHEAIHDVHVPHVHHDSHHDHHVVHHDHHHDDYHHDPWDHHYHRSDESPQQMAYNGYVNENKM